VFKTTFKSKVSSSGLSCPSIWFMC
jgi:hypothetical protein